MRWYMMALSLAVAAGTVSAGRPVTPAEKTVLFNGKNFAGWVKYAPDEAVDVDKVWTVRDGVIHCLGKPNGFIRTELTYADYRLHVEWRWVGKPTNSGVLLHSAPPDKVWPKSVEAQLMDQNAGDFWLIDQATLVVKGTRVGPARFANGKKFQESSEKPAGEWNKYDIVCDGGKVRLTVNGVLQNEGADANPASGHICLQSEGSPIQFRNIHLEPLAPGGS